MAFESQKALAVAFGREAYAYGHGYGYPGQEAAIERAFAERNEHKQENGVEEPCTLFALNDKPLDKRFTGAEPAGEEPADENP